MVFYLWSQSTYRVLLARKLHSSCESVEARSTSLNGALIELAMLNSKPDSKCHKNFTDFLNAITIKIKTPKALFYCINNLFFTEEHQHEETFSFRLLARSLVNPFDALLFVFQNKLSLAPASCYQRQQK